jgi:predicted ribosome quality control (RQC) complex YloA/Tae2 family protein
LLTDWLLVRRLGAELEQQLRGARVTGVVRLPDGRIALGLRKAGAELALAADPFASPPLLVVEAGAPAGTVEPGFIRSADATLRGTTLTAVRARRGDRLLRLTFASRSRFGVGDEAELYVELVPRFGNLALVKRDRVVAAAKEFSLAENGTRAVEAGLTYSPPPLPARPLLPKLLAESGVDPAQFEAYAQSEAALEDPLYVYRRDGALLQAHLFALRGFEGAAETREPSLLALFAELRARDVRRGERERSGRRRRTAVARLDARERKLRDELAALQAQRRTIRDRAELRDQGETIFAHLHALPAAQQPAEKERAGKLFARYKKLGAALPHVARRETQLESALAAVEMLRWEAERAGADELDDLEEAIAQVEGRRAAVARGSGRLRKRKRAPLEFRTADGSRIVVGRSPAENAELTFKLARPNDLWFHARGIPGAHVILARDDRREPSARDVETAASLAAYYSKAKTSARAAVDYTLRKYVRKQRDAAPGLVWYTNASTTTAEPREPAPEASEGVVRPRGQDSASKRSGGATT